MAGTSLVEPDSTLEIAASRFATAAHGEQMYGRQPYSMHLADVVFRMRLFGIADPEVLAAGWLHDTLEDTNTSYVAVQEQFGPRVLALVQAVTRPKGFTRKASNAQVYLQVIAYPDALPVKLADRLSNVRACWGSRDPRLFMYRDEYAVFRRSLHGLGVTTQGLVGPTRAMWAALDEWLDWKEG